MSAKLIEIDRRGDTLIILSSNDFRPAYSTSAPGPGYQPEIHLLCSKKHLTLASRRADKMFDSGFKEATPEESDGLYHRKFDAIFDPTAFELVIKIIHGKNRDIPRTVHVQLLADISTVVDDLECHDVLCFFAKGWLAILSQVMFEASTKTAITGYWASMQMTGLPIRPEILEEIQKRREKALAKLVDGLHDVKRKLLSQKLGCSPGCRAMLLGTLIQLMNECGLYSPRPTKPFCSLDLKTLTEFMRKRRLPEYYSSANGSPAGSHSGAWTMSSYPSGLNSQGRNVQSGWDFLTTRQRHPKDLCNTIVR